MLTEVDLQRLCKPASNLTLGEVGSNLLAPCTPICTFPVLRVAASKLSQIASGLVVRNALFLEAAMEKFPWVENNARHRVRKSLQIALFRAVPR